jgi:hypothetical protein
MALGGVAVMILLLGIVFLLVPATREKFRAGRNGFLAALMLFLLLGAMFFFLQ